MGSRKGLYHFYEHNRFHGFFVPTKYACIMFWIQWPYPVCKRNYWDSLAWFMTTKCSLNPILNISKQTSHEYPQSPLSHKMGCYFTENVSVTYKIKLILWLHSLWTGSLTSLAKLDSICTQMFHLSLGECRSSPVESLYVEAYEPPLFIIETHRKKCLCYISSNWTPIQEIRFVMLCVIPSSGIDTQGKKRLWITLAYIVSNY